MVAMQDPPSLPIDIHQKSSFLEQMKRLFSVMKNKYTKHISLIKKELENLKEENKKFQRYQEENISLCKQIDKLKEQLEKKPLPPPPKEPTWEEKNHKIQLQERVIAFLQERVEGEKLSAAQLQHTLIELQTKIRQ